MTVARFGPFKISTDDHQIANSGVPVHVYADSSGSPGSLATIFSDDAGSVEITGQQENFVPDATGVTTGSEAATTTHGVVLTDGEGDITFVAPVGDYWLGIPGVQNPLKIQLTAGPAGATGATGATGPTGPTGP